MLALASAKRSKRNDPARARARERAGLGERLRPPNRRGGRDRHGQRRL